MDTLTYAWEQMLGPSVDLSDQAAAAPTFTPSEAGVLMFELTVFDGQVWSLPDQVWVTVSDPQGNHPPVADAGADQTADVMDEVTLDGSGSSDADGDELNYLWTQVKGPKVGLSSLVEVQPTFVPIEVGVYQFELTVDDGKSVGVPDRTWVVVNDPDAGDSVPVAVAGDDMDVLVGDTITLDATKSFDPDGGRLTYRWRQVAGLTVLPPSEAARALIQFQIPKVGRYVFELTVFDGVHWSRPDEVTVVARLSDNQPPVADAGEDIIGARVGVAVELDGSGSSDPEGAELTYAWSQVSGPEVELTGADSVRATFTPDQEGTYTFQLVVSDGELESQPDQVSVEVVHAGPGAQDDGCGCGAGRTGGKGLLLVFLMAATTLMRGRMRGMWGRRLVSPEND